MFVGLKRKENWWGCETGNQWDMVVTGGDEINTQAEEGTSSGTESYSFPSDGRKVARDPDIK